MWSRRAKHRQSAGRGSHGRDWSSPEGGAWFTLAVPMTEPQAATPLVVGDAIQQVLLTEAPGVTIKPPNDLLLNGKKIVGILCEQTLTAGGANQPTVFIGVGINVNLDPAALPADLRMPATSLRETLGRELDIPHLTRRCAARALFSRNFASSSASNRSPPVVIHATMSRHRRWTYSQTSDNTRLRLAARLGLSHRCGDLTSHTSDKQSAVP